MSLRFPVEFEANLFRLQLKTFVSISNLNSDIKVHKLQKQIFLFLIWTKKLTKSYFEFCPKKAPKWVQSRKYRNFKSYQFGDTPHYYFFKFTHSWFIKQISKVQMRTRTFASEVYWPLPVVILSIVNALLHYFSPF